MSKEAFETKRVTPGCRIANATGLKALTAVGQRMEAGGCPLEEKLFYVPTQQPHGSEEIKYEIAAQLPPCNVCELKGTIADFTYVYEEQMSNIVEEFPREF